MAPEAHFLLPVSGIGNVLVPARVFDSVEEAEKLRNAVARHADFRGVKERFEAPKVTHIFNPETRRIEPNSRV
jgi:hypothetical protein